VPDLAERTLLPRVEAKVLPASVVYTDEWRPYDRLEGDGLPALAGEPLAKGLRGWRRAQQHHRRVWSLAKRGISGVYHSVSTQHLQSYLDEYDNRYNHRHDGGRGMFDALLNRVQKMTPEAAS